MRRPERGKHVDLESPRGYYLDLSALADSGGPPGRFDPSAAAVRPDGSTPSPAEVARCALGNLEIYLGNGNSARRDRFEAGARFLINELEVVPATFGGWAMTETPRAYRDHLPSGWFCGGVQGECVSVLARAASLLGIEEALEAARAAVAAFAAPVADGGLLREIGDEGGEGGLDSLAFIEEYPIEHRPVLNLSGHVRASLGIHDFSVVASDPGAASLFERCVRGLEFELDRFDLGYWTRPDLDQGCDVAEVSSAACLREHALLLGVMHELTGRSAFGAAARRWGGYHADWRSRSKAFLRRLSSRVARISATRG